MQAQPTETARAPARPAVATATSEAVDAVSDTQASADMPDEQAIRQAAYALYEARGCADGHELDDWLRAKTQLQQARASTTGH